VSIRKTRGPRERAFVIKAALIRWALVAAFVAAMLLLPAPERFLLWVPCIVLAPIGVRIWNPNQFRIRREESEGRGGVG
jgi:hypothetical protein